MFKGLLSPMRRKLKVRQVQNRSYLSQTLWERERVGRFGRMALKHVKYRV